VGGLVADSHIGDIFGFFIGQAAGASRARGVSHPALFTSISGAWLDEQLQLDDPIAFSLQARLRTASRAAKWGRTGSLPIVLTQDGALTEKQFCSWLQTRNIVRICATGLDNLQHASVIFGKVNDAVITATSHVAEQEFRQQNASQVIRKITEHPCLLYTVASCVAATWVVDLASCGARASQELKFFKGYESAVHWNYLELRRPGAVIDVSTPSSDAPPCVEGET